MVLIKGFIRFCGIKSGLILSKFDSLQGAVGQSDGIQFGLYSGEKDCSFFYLVISVFNYFKIN